MHVGKDYPLVLNLPAKGLPRSEVQRRLNEFQSSGYPRSLIEKDVRGINFHHNGLDDVREVAEYAYLRFMDSNVITPLVPDDPVKQMEQEIVTQMGRLWGLENPTGTITSGGTESNISSSLFFF